MAKRETVGSVEVEAMRIFLSECIEFGPAGGELRALTHEEVEDQVKKYVDGREIVPGSETGLSAAELAAVYAEGIHDGLAAIAKAQTQERDQ